jgi:hypothetical protein
MKMQRDPAILLKNLNDPDFNVYDDSNFETKSEKPEEPIRLSLKSFASFNELIDDEDDGRELEMTAVDVNRGAGINGPETSEHELIDDDVSDTTVSDSSDEGAAI